MEKEINRTIKILKEGGVILYPTDTLWGIGCDATNKNAIDRVFEIKKRKKNRALISLVKDTTMIDRFTDSNQLKQNIPKKPTTIIFQNVSGLASNLIGNDNTAAFRIPNDAFCNGLVTLFGNPIVSTSANISGETNPEKFSEISEEIKNNVDYIVNLRQDELMNIPSAILMINKNGCVKQIR